MYSNKENSWQYFENRACKYFPCHGTQREKGFNCLFCYCPLYLLGESCGGNFTYTKDKIKNCSNCLLPHETENFQAIIKEKLFKKINTIHKLNEQNLQKQTL